MVILVVMAHHVPPWVMVKLDRFTRLLDRGHARQWSLEYAAKCAFTLAAATSTTTTPTVAATVTTATARHPLSSQQHGVLLMLPIDGCLINAVIVPALNIFVIVFILTVLFLVVKLDLAG